MAGRWYLCLSNNWKPWKCEISPLLSRNSNRMAGFGGKGGRPIVLQVLIIILLTNIGVLWRQHVGEDGLIMRTFRLLVCWKKIFKIRNKRFLTAFQHHSLAVRHTSCVGVHRSASPTRKGVSDLWGHHIFFDKNQRWRKSVSIQPYFCLEHFVRYSGIWLKVCHIGAKRIVCVILLGIRV